MRNTSASDDQQHAQPPNAPRRVEPGSDHGEQRRRRRRGSRVSTEPLHAQRMNRYAIPEPRRSELASIYRCWNRTTETTSDKAAATSRLRSRRHGADPRHQARTERTGPRALPARRRSSRRTEPASACSRRLVSFLPVAVDSAPRRPADRSPRKLTCSRCGSIGPSRRPGPNASRRSALSTVRARHGGGAGSPAAVTGAPAGERQRSARAPASSATTMPGASGDDRRRERSPGRSRRGHQSPACRYQWMIAGPGEQADDTAERQERPERHGRLATLLDPDARHHASADERGGKDADEDRHRDRAAEEQPEDRRQLDVTHAHAARVGERERQQKPARGGARDQLLGHARADRGPHRSPPRRRPPAA